MRWIEDPDEGRRWRPFFEETELDTECELVVQKFLLQRHGEVKFPISTDDLTVLVERHASDLDRFADLRHEGNDVQGVTDFAPPAKPRVRIAGYLWKPALERRLRTTLAHELGHVILHGVVAATRADLSLRCEREVQVDAPRVDWLEWQAGWCCTALLAPRSSLDHVVDVVGRADADALVTAVSAEFLISRHAALVRLQKTRHLPTTPC